MIIQVNHMIGLEIMNQNFQMVFYFLRVLILIIIRVLYI